MSDPFGPFGDCKSAPLHQIGSVQGHGALVAISSAGGRIEYCSANSGEVLEIEPAQLLEESEGDRFAARCLAVPTPADRGRFIDWTVLEGSVPSVVMFHRQGAHRIFEFERATPVTGAWWNHAARSEFLEQLTAVRSIARCYEFLVDRVFELSGYDRVMMYRFLPQWHGEVVYEKCRPGVDGFLGLRFPASDIPPNARQLFLLNRQRSIVDVDATPSDIVGGVRTAEPLDLTYSVLRAAHPVHIQYLRNMGVQASLTLSLVLNGKLWGMIACHHFSARRLSIADRLALEEMSRLVSLHMTNLDAANQRSLRSEMRLPLAQVQGSLSAIGEDAKVALSLNVKIIRETFGAHGVWLRFEGEDIFSGLVPDKLSLGPLRDLLELLPRDRVSQYDTLPEPLASYRALAGNASGLLFIPLGSADFVALMRPEVVATVSWAGKPPPDPPSLQESGSLAPGPLSLRNSFAAWSQVVKNTSEPWSDLDVEFAEVLRTDLQRFLGTARLEQIALHDALTGLANRHLFERRLQLEVKNAIARNTAFAVYMIDLDRFKQVNDTFGHGAGDQLLSAVAARLKDLAKSGDTVARLGGDEFGFIQSAIEEQADAVALAERIVETICLPYEIAGNTLEIGTSVGVSICPSDTVDKSELLECADLALYQVKRLGKNNYSMYTSAMRSGLSRGISGEVVLDAIRNEEFLLHYQPIIDARTGDLRGMEAFVRWRRPGAAERVADEFMSLLVEKRLTSAVEAWVIEAAFKQYKDWSREGLPLVPISINVGAADFATQDLVGLIERLGEKYEMGWQWLRLDIKEDALLADVSYAVRKLSKLLEMGVGANLDNFGLGCVPIGSLTQLPFQGIKLDADMFVDKSSRQNFHALFNVVKSVAQVFNAQLTVTKIETLEMLEELRSQQVDLLQGRAICAPAEGSKAAEWLTAAELFRFAPATLGAAASFSFGFGNP